MCRAFVCWQSFLKTKAKYQIRHLNIGGLDKDRIDLEDFLMNNDKYDSHHHPTGSPQRSSREMQHGDTPSGKSSSLKRGLLFEDDLERLGSFSLDGLRKNFPDPNDRVMAIWGFLSAELADRAVGLERCFTNLAMLDELVQLGGFEISNNAREYFYEHFIPPYVIRRLKGDS